MKNIILLLFISAFSLLSYSQTKVFKTYEDYANGTGEVMDDDFIRTFESSFGMSVKFKSKEGDIKSYNPKHIWGFLFKGNFFRTVGKELAMLEDTGKVNYFINGFAAIGILTNPDRKEGHYLEGQSSCYLSVGDMSAKVYRMPISTILKRDYKDFKEDFPDFDDLYDCFVFSGNITIIYQTVRDCVKEFNSKAAKKKRK